MNIIKVFASVFILLAVSVQQVSAAITSADISGAGLSTVAGSGTISDMDIDGDGLADGVSVAHITFTLNSTDAVTIDGLAKGFYSRMYLFDNADNELYKDQAGTDGKTNYSGILSAGTYTVTLSVLGYSSEDALLGFAEGHSFDMYCFDYDFGDWNWSLVVHAEPTATEVPVPAAMPLFLSALIGLVGIARRR